MSSERYERLRDAIQDRIFYFMHPPKNLEEEHERAEAYRQIEALVSAGTFEVPGRDFDAWASQLKLAAFRLMRRDEQIPISEQNHQDVQILRAAQDHLATYPPQITRDAHGRIKKYRVPLAGPHLTARLMHMALDMGAKNLSRENEVLAFAEMVRLGLADGSDVPTDDEGWFRLLGEAGGGTPATSEGAMPTPAATPARSKKMSRDEANVIVREWIAKNASKDPRTKLRRDAIARGTGISAGTVSNTAAWQAYSRRWNGEHGPTARNIPLTDRIEARIPVDDVGKAESEQKNALLHKLIQDEELKKLIQEQEAERTEEDRRHKRRHGPS